MNVILMDVDGVICDFFGGVAEHLRELGFKPKPFQEFDLKATLTEEELEAAVEWLGRPGTCESLPTFGYGPGGAQWFVDECRRHGDVYFVTAPWKSSYTWAKERTTWLQRHFGANPDHVLLVPGTAKRMVYGNFLIEDKPETAQSWGETWYGRGLLLQHAGNLKDRERMPGAKYYTECRSYTEILQHLEKK